MHDYLLALILGVVEGITEFLPISSTAHLRIAQHWLGLSLEDEFWKLFAVLIQLGAILAVIALYRARLVKFTLAAIRFEHKLHQSPATLILIAFVCTAVPAFALKKVIGLNLENIGLMAGSLFVGGIVMLAVERLCRSPRVHSVEEMSLLQAIFIGCVQVLSAVFPGTSRSMSTIAAGQIAGLSRSAALDFSFFVSIPVMVAATVYDFYKYLKGAPLDLSSHQWTVLAIGFVTSFVVAYAVIVWFLGFVKNHGFTWFAWYRIALAGLVLLVG